MKNTLYSDKTSTGHSVVSSIRDSRGNRIFDDKGEINAYDNNEALLAGIQVLSQLGKGNLVNENEAEQRENTFKENRKLIVAAFDDPALHQQLGETITASIQQVANREGFARNFLMYKEVLPGQDHKIEVDINEVTAVTTHGATEIETQYLRNNVIYPKPIDITAKPFYTKQQIYSTSSDIIERAYNEGLQAIMVGEDKLWKRMVDAVVGLDNDFVNISGNLTPATFSNLVDQINNWGLTARRAIISHDVMGDIRANPTSWGFDPVTQHNVLNTGVLLRLYNVDLMLDHTAHESHRVLNKGDIYVVADKHQHGEYSDLGGITSKPIDESQTNTLGRGWFMSEVWSAAIGNSKSVVHAKRTK